MTAQTLTLLAVDLIDPSPDQNRTDFDAASLGELAASIREIGLLQPVTVRLECGRYILIAGERRLRAVKLLGWAEVPAIVTDGDTDNALRTLAENMVRVDPGPLEQAEGLARVLENFDGDVSAVAVKLGKSPRWIRERLALLALAPDVAHYVQTGNLPLGRAVAMSELDVNRQRLALQAHEHGISPDAFSALVAKLLTEQSEECMFDVDSFLKLEEYVVAAEEEAQAQADAKVIRERPLGLREIAELLEVKYPTVRTWVTRKLLPAPDGMVSGSPFWWEPTVLAWARETGRAK